MHKSNIKNNFALFSLELICRELGVLLATKCNYEFCLSIITKYGSMVLTLLHISSAAGYMRLLPNETAFEPF